MSETEMTTTCAKCGEWLDDLELATAPFGLCFGCSEDEPSDSPSTTIEE